MNTDPRRVGASRDLVQFLEEFVGGKPWVHLDIAATAYTENWARTPPYQPPSCATGVGVRLLVELARRWSA